MPYLVLDENGRLGVDSATRAASEIFGLGRRKKSFIKRRMARKLRIAKRLAPLAPPAALLVAASRRGRKRRRGGEPPAAQETALIAPAGPIPEVGPEGEPIDERVAPAEEPPVAEAPSAAEAPGEPEAAEAPESAAPEPSEAEESVEEAPETSVEGGGCGGYILTAPSPKQRDFVNRRSKAAALDTPPYKGLGQDEGFWFEPEWVFERTAPVSAWPPPADGIHRGSPVWGAALAEAPFVDPFGEGVNSPFLSGLGEASDSTQAALREYTINAQAAAQVAADVARLRPANFKSEAERLSRAVRVYLDHYEKFIHGKTGNEEAERRLRHMWVSINRELAAAIQRWPSVTEQVIDKGKRFIEDFRAAVRRVLEEYDDWLVKTARDALRRYHAARVRLMRLKRAGGPDPEGIIPKVERLVERIRNTFRQATGKDIDDLAQKEYGAYPTLGAKGAGGTKGLSPLERKVLIGAFFVIAAIVAIEKIIGLFRQTKEASGDIAGIIAIAAGATGLLLFIAKS
jgi:hypothetical protein